jgi:hypothetical protein
VRNEVTGVELPYGRRVNKPGAPADDTGVQSSAKYAF